MALNIPFGQAKRDAALEAARAEQARTAAQRDDRQNNLLAELHDTHARTQASQDTAALYTQRLLPLAEQALEAALADFAAGSGTARSVIDAEDDLLQTRLGALDARTEAYRGRARLLWLAGPEAFDIQPPLYPQERSP